MYHLLSSHVVLLLAKSLLRVCTPFAHLLCKRLIDMNTSALIVGYETVSPVDPSSSVGFGCGVGRTALNGWVVGAKMNSAYEDSRCDLVACRWLDKQA